MFKEVVITPAEEEEAFFKGLAKKLEGRIGRGGRTHGDIVRDRQRDEAERAAFERKQLLRQIGSNWTAEEEVVKDESAHKGSIHYLAGVLAVNSARSVAQTEQAEEIQYSTLYGLRLLVRAASGTKCGQSQFLHSFELINAAEKLELPTPDLYQQRSFSVLAFHSDTSGLADGDEGEGSQAQRLRDEFVGQIDRVLPSAAANSFLSGTINRSLLAQSMLWGNNRGTESPDGSYRHFPVFAGHLRWKERCGHALPLHWHLALVIAGLLEQRLQLASAGVEAAQAAKMMLSGANRIPAAQGGEDCLRLEPESRHILLVRNGHVFALYVKGERTSAVPTQYSLHPAIVANALAAHVLPKTCQNNARSFLHLASLQNRKAWYTARCELLTDSSKEHLLGILETALFAVVIDETSRNDDEIAAAFPRICWLQNGLNVIVRHKVGITTLVTPASFMLNFAGALCDSPLGLIVAQLERTMSEAAAMANPEMSSNPMNSYAQAAVMAVVDSFIGHSLSTPCPVLRASELLKGLELWEKQQLEGKETNPFSSPAKFFFKNILDHQNNLENVNQEAIDMFYSFLHRHTVVARSCSCERTLLVHPVLKFYFDDVAEQTSLQEKLCHLAARCGEHTPKELENALLSEDGLRFSSDGHGFPIYVHFATSSYSEVAKLSQKAFDMAVYRADRCFGEEQVCQRSATSAAVVIDEILLQQIHARIFGSACGELPPPSASRRRELGACVHAVGAILLHFALCHVLEPLEPAHETFPSHVHTTSSEVVHVSLAGGRRALARLYQEIFLPKLVGVLPQPGASPTKHRASETVLSVLAALVDAELKEPQQKISPFRLLEAVNASAALNAVRLVKLHETTEELTVFEPHLRSFLSGPPMWQEEGEGEHCEPSPIHFGSLVHNPMRQISAVVRSKMEPSQLRLEATCVKATIHFDYVFPSDAMAKAFAGAVERCWNVLSPLL